ncbi:MAG: hypothetical protein HY898_02330 [Deltaproteobacteria bacterium]|nr:hypothetical protein [Deltaproteobacteria bacterium]
MLATVCAACVPNGPPAKGDAGATATTTEPRKPTKPTPPKPAASMPPAPMLTAPFEDKFDRTVLGPDWYPLTSNWEVRDGKLCGKSVRNRGVWLNRTLPVNARIEFEAVSSSPDGDLKAEFWGDGRSGATQASYTNATSYLTIFGGWKNTFHVLARIDEHAPDRLQVPLSADSVEEREKPVVAGRSYGFKVERSDGKTIQWWVDGVLIHRLEDKQPMSGPGHDRFGFNDWEVPVCFDNLRVTPL